MPGSCLFMMKYFSPIVFLLSLLLMAGCTRNDDQREFEKEAYALPRDYTETTNQGAIVNVDEDDWRTSPLFQGLIVIKPPFPNPVRTDISLNLEIEVTFGNNSINGLQIVTFYNNDRSKPVVLYQDFETLPNGQYSTINIDPKQFDKFGNPEGARGLNRIYIFNGNQQMISYGDIMVE